MTIFILPWKKYIKSQETITIKLNIYSKTSILFMIIALFIVATASRYIPILKEIDRLSFGEILSFDVIKQFAIITSSLLIAILYMTNRKDSKPINFTEWLGDIFFYFYANWLNIRVQKEDSSEPWAIENLERQTTNKLKSIHNQQTAIFIVFTIFIIMLIVFTANI